MLSGKTQTKSKSTDTKAPAVAIPRFPPWLLAGVLALVTLALYWPATQCDFINCDDDVYITDNVHVQKGLSWENIQWAFLNPVSANWHPLTTLSHMLDCECYGLNPWGHHLTNILLHTLNTVLVFLLLRSLTGALWRSLLAAALFGWHPLHVESVAWVAERKDVLSCLFWVLTLWAYTNYARLVQMHNSKTKVWYIATLALLALGLMSKPMLVTLPCVMLLLDYWPLARFQSGRARQLLIEKIPFFVLTVAASAVTLAVQNQGGAVNPVDRFPLDARVGNALISYCRYLGKFFWPTDLAIFYPHPVYWPLDDVLLAAFFLGGVSAALFLMRKTYPFMLMGWLWFVGTLVPVIGLVQVGEQSMADRYSYIPSLGLFVAIIWGAAELCRFQRLGVKALSVAGAAALVVCLILTRQQLEYWKSSETIYKHAIAVTENNAFAINNLGCALLSHGQIDEAVDYLQEGLRLRPAVAECQNNLANALLAKGRVDEAIFHSQEAIRLKPNFGRAHLILGNALFDKGQVDEAIVEYQESARLEPGEVIGHINLGVALLNKGRLDEAIAELQAGLRLKPDNEDAHYNLGVALLKKGRIDDAISQLQEALRLRPSDADAKRDLAKALDLKNR